MVQISTALRTDPAASPLAPSDTRRREILAAASRLFRERGFAATGMREIAAELAMTAGSLYYYFENKQALLAFCQQETLDELAAEPESSPSVASASPADSLRRLIVQHVVALNEIHPGSLAHLEIEALEPERRAPLLLQRRAYERRVENLIRAGVADGSFRARALDVRLATLALLGALNWTVKWFRSDGGRTAAEVGEQFADLFLHGLTRKDD